MNSKILGLLAVGLLAGPIAAEAVPVGPGPLGQIDNQSFAIAYDSFEGFFNAVWGFDLAGSGQVSGQAAATNISGFYLYFFSGNNVVGTDANPADGFSFAGLAPGSYALLFLGTGGSGRGNISGEFSAVTDAAVPEPGTLALLGLGLTGLGFMRRRKA